MKELFIVVALGTVIAAPAFAQQTPSNRPSQQKHRVHPYAADIPYEARGYGYNNIDNPDFQLGGGERWKPSERVRRASRHISQK
jgi:hypothetical protein